MSSCASDPKPALLAPPASEAPTERIGLYVYPRQPMDPTLALDRQSSRDWVSELRAEGPVQQRALADLHGLLLRAARFELRRRRAALSHVRGEELEDIALQAADDAMVAVLAKLHQYRGASRFTTWAYKFALLEAGVKLRRRAWQGREIVLEPEAWPAFADRSSSAHQMVERSELLDALRDAVNAALTPHQREVFMSLALNQVPIDVLAERLATTRGALYKTLHDARRKLRADLAAAGFAELELDITSREDR